MVHMQNESLMCLYAIVSCSVKKTCQLLPLTSKATKDERTQGKSQRASDLFITTVRGRGIGHGSFDSKPQQGKALEREIDTFFKRKQYSFSEVNSADRQTVISISIADVTLKLFMRNHNKKKKKPQYSLVVTRGSTNSQRFLSNEAFIFFFYSLAD